MDVVSHKSSVLRSSSLRIPTGAVHKNIIDGTYMYDYLDTNN